MRGQGEEAGSGQLDPLHLRSVPESSRKAGLCLPRRPEAVAPVFAVGPLGPPVLHLGLKTPGRGRRAVRSWPTRARTYTRAHMHAHARAHTLHFRLGALAQRCPRRGQLSLPATCRLARVPCEVASPTGARDRPGAPPSCCCAGTTVLTPGRVGANPGARLVRTALRCPRVRSDRAPGRAARRPSPGRDRL